jgi:uncharacterized protein YecT (DUF1311 family)
MRSLITAILLSTASLHGYAAATATTHPLDNWVNAELTKAAGVTSEVRAVYSEARKRWDKELNSAYQRLQSKLDEPQKKNLVSAQRNWLKWRDEELKLHSSIVLTPGSGTLALVVDDEFFITLLRQRVFDLLRYEKLHDSPP